MKAVWALRSKRTCKGSIRDIEKTVGGGLKRPPKDITGSLEADKRAPGEVREGLRTALRVGDGFPESIELPDALLVPAMPVCVPVLVLETRGSE